MKKIKHNLKDTLLNFIRKIKAQLRARDYNGETRSVSLPNGYSQVFLDKFESPLNQENWRYGPGWGDFHPDGLYQYYDTDGTLSYVSPEGLILELRNNPKTYVKSELPDWRQTPQLPDKFTIPTGVGYVTSKIGWQYGWFESWVQLPYGQSYWPAFWLSGVNSWPPEIDIFEAYSDQSPDYAKKHSLGKTSRIQPNLHYGVVENGTKEMYGPYDVAVADCTNRLVQYVCHWEKDFIRIYYDGGLVFETTDQKILNWYNGEKDQMKIILNHGRTENQPNGLPNESAMIVRSVSVSQKF